MLAFRRGGGTHISISYISIIWALYILYLPFWHHDRPTFERLNSSGSSGSEMDLGGRAQRAKILNSTSSYLISLFEMRPISYICDIRDMSATPHVRVARSTLKLPLEVRTQDCARWV